MKSANRMTGMERFLFKEIGVEFKACLYFFCILFFYSMYRMIQGVWDASIVHMIEMILTAYFMGYFQVLVLSNFDEGERLGIREICYTILCSGLYTVVAALGKWFDGRFLMIVTFFLYMLLVYICAFLVYKIKRDLDTKQLNEELRAFQERSEK
ncbi:MAG: DUF3021 family protein [Lachnospiraceae bacterium]|nr:DUF3021 family protein [Lachnospiraceae bacterium]